MSSRFVLGLRSRGLPAAQVQQMVAPMSLCSVLQRESTSDGDKAKGTSPTCCNSRFYLEPKNLSNTLS